MPLALSPFGLTRLISAGSFFGSTVYSPVLSFSPSFTVSLSPLKTNRSSAGSGSGGSLPSNSAFTTFQVPWKGRSSLGTSFSSATAVPASASISPQKSASRIMTDLLMCHIKATRHGYQSTSFPAASRRSCSRVVPVLQEFLAEFNLLFHGADAKHGLRELRCASFGAEGLPASARRAYFSASLLHFLQH